MAIAENQVPPVAARVYKSALIDLERAGTSTASGNFSKAGPLLNAGEAKITKVTAVVNPGANGESIGLCQKIVLADSKEIFLRDSLPQELQRGARGVCKID